MCLLLLVPLAIIVNVRLFLFGWLGLVWVFFFCWVVGFGVFVCLFLFVCFLVACVSLANGVLRKKLLHTQYLYCNLWHYTILLSLNFPTLCL